MSSASLATSAAAAPDIPEPAASPRIVPQRRPGRWTAAVAVPILLGLAVTSVVRDQAFQWGVAGDHFTSDSVLRGLWLILPIAVAVIGLTLREAAYAAEVVRGGILSVGRGQVGAARALGLGRRRRWRRIVLPQAMRSIVPPAGNMLIGTLKGTSIVSVGQYYVEKHYARGSERTR
jgi:ABC-type amino acid transport system permease subunit